MTQSPDPNNGTHMLPRPLQNQRIIILTYSKEKNRDLTSSVRTCSKMVCWSPIVKHLPCHCYAMNTWKTLRLNCAPCCVRFIFPPNLHTQCRYSFDIELLRSKREPWCGQKKNWTLTLKSTCMPTTSKYKRETRAHQLLSRCWNLQHWTTVNSRQREHM